MAHPHHAHKDHKVQKSRVSHITRNYATGGAVHSDEAADRKLFKKMIAEHEREEGEPEGGKSKRRADRVARKKGGRVKGKKPQVNVNVITGAGGAPHPGVMPIPVPAGAPPVPPAANAIPPRPPMAPPALPPGAGAPGPSGLPGMMPRRDGGRAYAKGGAVKSGPAWEEGRKAGTQVSHDPGKNDGKNLGRGKPVTYNKGGKVCRATGGRIESPEGVADATKLPGGAGGGKGRLAKIEKYGP